MILDEVNEAVGVLQAALTALQAAVPSQTGRLGAAFRYGCGDLLAQRRHVPPRAARRRRGQERLRAAGLMTGIVISQTFSAPFTVRLDWMFRPVAGDPQDHRLANAVVIALNTDRRALPDDVLPDRNSDDRRGWWGDTDAGAIWGAKAPIGSRLWLLTRAKLPGGTREGATIERARRYIREALQPLVDMKVASKFTVDLVQDAPDRISGTITIFRGPKTAIALAFQDLWRDFAG